MPLSCGFILPRAPELKALLHTACLYHHCPERLNTSRFVVAGDNRSTMKLALLLSALATASARVAPLRLRKTKGLQAAGGAKAKGGYGQWAKDNAMANGVVIGAFKTAAADLIAQASDSESELDLKRNFLFFVLGGAYLGAFQRFTSQSLEKKLKDTEGLVQLAMQIVLNLTILSCVYLPTFYLFKQVFFGDSDLLSSFGETWTTYTSNFETDLPALFKCWGPADLVCFSVPLYLRIPIRHVVSFCWTIYFSMVQSKK